MKKLLIRLIVIYQKYFSFDKGLLAIFAPGGACRYTPSCSDYTKQQISEVGAVKGIWLGVKRIWRCR